MDLVSLVFIGILLVAFWRQILGFNSLDVCSPILLAYVFGKMSLAGNLQIIAFVFISGCLFNLAFKPLELLSGPRICLILMAAMLFISLATMRIALRVGQEVYFYFLILISLWILERFFSIQMEHGTTVAIKITFETLLLAVMIHGVSQICISMGISANDFLWLFLFVCLILILLGHHTGPRLTELWRFRRK